MGGPATYETSFQLRDGGRVNVRPLTPEDEEALHDAFSRMSERTVYFRFFSPLKRLPEDLAHRLAQVDGEARYALCATHRLGHAHAQEHIVGVARYDRIAGAAVAEVAVAVVDEFQHQGLGAQLLTMLARVAREHAIDTFTLIVLPENQSMLKLLRKMGWIHQARLHGGMYEITFHLPAEA
ncbi:MAG: GNAT family N-acetyltransferase [Chloroflexota bacterium]